MSSPAYQPDNIFAKILRGEMPCYKVFEDDVALAFMDIPKTPARGLLDMPADALGPYMQRVQTVAAAAKAAMKADGLTIQQFNETAGGQVVFHLHFHILPRWDGVALKPPGTMGDKAALEANAARIRAAL